MVTIIQSTGHLLYCLPQRKQIFSIIKGEETSKCNLVSTLSSLGFEESGFVFRLS